MEISELLFELSHPTRLEILRLITEAPSAFAILSVSL